MKKNLIFFAILFLFNYNTIGAQVGDVSLPQSLNLNNQTLTLNGAGFRSKFFIQLYVGALYLTEKTGNPQMVIDSDAPMSIYLHMVSDRVTNEKLKAACIEGFKKATGGNTAPINKEIDQFIALFADKVQSGDTFSFNYHPTKGVDVFKNNSHLDSIPGLPFKKALFGIWLCDQPADKSLKKKMLGL